MNKREERSEFEKQIGLAWRSANLTPTEKCLLPEDIFEVVERGEKTAKTAPLMEHIRDCPYCLREYTEMRTALWEAAHSQHEDTTDPKRAKDTRTDVPPYQGDPARSRDWLFRSVFSGAMGALAASFLLFFVAIRPLETRLAGRDAALFRLQSEASQHKNTLVVLSADRDAALQKALRATHAEEAAKAETRHLLAVQGDGSELWLKRLASELLPTNQDFTYHPWVKAGPDQKPDRSIHLIAPIGVVHEDRPVFQWDGVSGAILLKLNIVRDTAYKELVSGSPAEPFLPAKRQWQPPHPLPRGKRYLWQLSAFDKAGKLIAQGTGIFYVLDWASLEKLEKVARLQFQIAQMYEHTHLFDAAAAQYRAVPSASSIYPTAQKQLRALQERRLHITHSNPSYD